MFPHNAEIIVFYDSDCLFCNKAIVYINRLDTKQVIYFSKLTGVIGCQLGLSKYSSKNNGSMVVIDAVTNDLYIASDAIIKIASCINGISAVSKIISLILPRWLRDLIYYKISNSRSTLSNYIACDIPSNNLLKQII